MSSRILLFLLVILAISGACRKDDLITDSSAKLEFSTDTLIFDTVFTTVGSVTQRVKVFNPHNKDIKVSNIYFKSGNASNFRMNIDGTPARALEDVLIRKNDSIFIFVEVTIDPNGGNLPLIVEDAIQFETNGNLQQVVLAAWGQDAYFYPTVIFESGFVFQLPCDKPNVFYGYGLVDSGAVLEIQPGCQIHFHEGAGLLVWKDATIRVLGEQDRPVVFQGDRLDDGFEDEPGQWEQIWLFKGSIDNEFHHTIIKNAIIGLRADSTSNDNPTAILNNTQIINCSAQGLLGQTARIEANNSVFANCGQFTALLAVGGDYTFNHCTFANYWRFETRQNGQLYFNNWFENIFEEIEARDFSATFNNCILYGTEDEEIELDGDEGAAFDFVFNHCVVRSELEELDDPTKFINTLVNPGVVVVDGVQRDPLFNDPFELDYTLFEQSRALEQGDPAVVNLSPVLATDIDGNDRSIGSPDLGAWQYVPE